MIDAFAFLQDEKLIYEIIIENTHLLNSKIEKNQSFSSELFSFQRRRFQSQLTKYQASKKKLSVWLIQKVKQMYGTQLPTL
ncbi:hypothetical protein ACEW7V_01465 [Areca yellow leaf disease phytoplasma]|uniref:hypothetical protein n=1 Tax=Areca yellow leaf disease phytoplasma TaxID=927614 RepID=UPI0035B564FB